ncbi:Various environmental stresses-induced protein [Bordetella ansorpii]|uniref:Various environmental stresses-induced protein n=1 Tax=Bordetella ansorpii TaxID=288768 RepID=A0A157LX29_9BORD|nr:HutD family protein [Bordetella ansorpii]SAI01327.1 Various environmental stresses-induced protein [Bordetella ansorpii]
MSPSFVRRLADVPAESWKNGGGVTRTLAVHGDEWRVSIATISQDGAYSRFPGLRRLSMILSGAGVVLRGSGGTVELLPWRPLQYDGALDWQARLADGPCQALNVMARDGAYELSACTVDGRAGIPAGVHALVLANGSQLSIGHAAEGRLANLHQDEYAVMAPGPDARTVVADAVGAQPILILIAPVPAGRS